MENVKNTNLIYGVIGLIIGIAITSLFCWNNHHRDVAEYSNQTQGGMMHQMADGSMMSNTGMDMNSMMNGMMAGLQGKTGDAFDKEFLAEMIVHHQGAVEMAQSALQNAKHQEIKDLANGIITAQNKEIGMMKQWQAEWYK